MMKTVLRASSLWLVLGGLVVLLGKGSPYAAPAAVILTPLAVWLTAQAVASLPERKAWRIGFWMVTVAGWTALLVLMQGRAQSKDTERQIVFFALDLAALAAIWLAAITRSLPSRRLLGEVAAGAVLLAVASGVFVWIYDAGTRSLIARADARWTEIGLPMAEFEKTLAPSRENAGSQVLRKVLRNEVNSLFYKNGTPAADREPSIQFSLEADQLLKQAVDLISANQPLSDDLKLAPESIAAFEPMAATLDTDYRRLLETEPARWASDARDGFAISVPNFLAIRRFAQIATAESMRRLSLGDQEGAARALAAPLRLRPGLLENPTLVSLMIGIAVDGMLCYKQVRLPASEDGLPAIARDVPRLRAEFVRRLQMEAWVALRAASGIDRREQGVPMDDGLMPQSVGDGVLPRWAARIVGPPWCRRQCAAGALNNAEHAAIQKSPATLALPDLGASLHEAVSNARPTVVEMNTARAIMRIYATLLVREQTELIRDARARLAAGRPVESRDSVVLPGVRWELIVDAKKGTVATRLAGAPEWIVTNAVTGKDFWVLPLDGSAAWQFRLHAPTASRD